MNAQDKLRALISAFGKNLIVPSESAHDGDNLTIRVSFYDANGLRGSQFFYESDFEQTIDNAWWFLNFDPICKSAAIYDIDGSVRAARWSYTNDEWDHI